MVKLKQANNQPYMTSSTPNMFINNKKHKLKPADSFKLKPKHKLNFIKTNILSNQFGTV